MGRAAACTLAIGIACCAVTTAEAATLSGRVRFDGPAPERPINYMSADPACDKLYPKGRPSEAVVVDAEGSLANVLVYVKTGLPKDFRSAVPAQAATIDQRGCEYVPHVLAVRAGQEIEIHNSDPTAHNLNARTAVNTPFNEAMPVQDEIIRKAFPRPEVAVKLKCDIHPWMSAYVGVFDHPFFAVTAPDGSFTIAGLPEGDYTVEAWHESLGTRSAKVSVKEKKPATVDFSFAGN